MELAPDATVRGRGVGAIGAGFYFIGPAAIINVREGQSTPLRREELFGASARVGRRKASHAGPSRRTEHYSECALREPASTSK